MNNKIERRGFLKSGVFAGIAGALVSINPLKAFSTEKKNITQTAKVEIHPLAIQRKRKDS
jgi:ABC-type branched-subunit amino acid transport system permease subunit